MRDISFPADRPSAPRSTPAGASREQSGASGTAPAAGVQPARRTAGFRLFGVPVRLHPSFLIVPAVLLYAPGRPVANVVTWIVMGSIALLCHELGHALALKFFGEEPQISLMGMFSFAFSKGMSRLSNAQMLAVVAAGPAAGLLLAAVALALGGHLPPYSYFFGMTNADRFLIINLAVSLINLVPIFPLDGGRIVNLLMKIVMPKNGETIAFGLSLITIAAAMWFSVNHDLQIFAVMLVFLGSLNFKFLQARSGFGRN